MNPVKRRQVTYLSPTELTLALLALDKFQRSIEVIEVDIDEGVAGPDDILLSDLDSIISKLHSRLGRLQHVDFPGAEESILHDLKIECSGDLILKPDYEKIVSIDVEAGKDQLWSSSAMYAHLTMLENSVQVQDEAGASLFINTFLFRVSAMVPSSHRMIIHPQHNPPSTLTNPSNLRATCAGYIYYTVVITERKIAPSYLGCAGMLSAKALKTGFFIIEAKEMGVSLTDHLPQALCELYECAVNLEQPIVRGALTNGRKWIFIIFYMNESGLGACYKTSECLEYNVVHDRKSGGKEKKIFDAEPDLIASVLLHWAQNSFVDIGKDDLFYEFSLQRGL